ncbi:myelin regulatory factor-like protein isoform X1 [Oncorhynchus kisutch]|uniref:Myelin regulatory factor like n=1 Tax=Oncorhynchus kisutch TaxID=8019 RepID=A0A8C7KNY9_ONCKI|nr:myelin regulatory factor-like protein isoform X1 [Oncorhynchus kisutch]XP_031671454.1 myelin regulatory factor-like protein isoform X2 [Oncorhynchus kisutch]XP_031671455.1 myelin regulatory factor-like protein isoform X1 [Oncorhynchus kisutch]
MEPPGGLPVPVDVLGENEALQQFFDGCQDMSGVLESAVVDTSILEQYLNNDMDPTFMLPESPPDSGSEPCSPPQIPDVSYGYQEVFQTVTRPPASSCRYKELAPQPPPHPGLPYHQGLTNSYTKAGTSPGSLPHNPPLHHPHYLSPGESYIQANTATTPPVHHKALQQHQPPPRQGLADSYPRANAPPVPELPPGQAPYLAPGLRLPSSCLLPVPGCPSEPGYSYLPPTAGQHTGLILPDCRKRRRTEPLEVQNHLVAVPIAGGSERGGGDVPSYDSDGATESSSGMGTYQLLTWDHYQPGLWTPLYNSNYDILPSPAYHVDTDKGFNYSTADESFVCQKKNHFQVTVHVGMAGDPLYVKTPNGPALIESFHIKVFGVKLEAQTHKVTIEQSQPDRSKKPFLPVKVSLPGDKITRVTLGRLHFSETTANNMRKKGKPNPDQRYFLMVVGLYATVREESYLLIAFMSERIVVRASNPGQFENDSEVLWQRGQAPDAVVCQGRVGINTDTPDEALVVCGNAKIMGQVMHPSDRRAKHNIQEVDSTEQLKRISQMRIVEYDYKPEFASEMGIDHIHETGILAQEVKELLPTAVKVVGDITCSDGERIHNFLMVDKEQIFMENVGAVKQLCKVTDNLENRIQELEVWNTRSAKLKDMGSPANSSNPANNSTKGKINRHSSVPPPQKPTPLNSVKAKFHHCLKHKFVQVSMIILVATMAFCSIAITALYMLTLRDDAGMLLPGNTNETTVHPLYTTTVSTTSVNPTTTPVPWTPDVDFCRLIYCEEVFCCPTTASMDNTSTISPALLSSTVSPTTGPSLADKGKDKFNEEIKGAGDWTNTTIKSFFIKENEQIIDSRYCERGSCGSGNYSFQIPISKFVPTNMRVTVQMNTTELLVVHLCHNDETFKCSALMDHDQTNEEYNFINTQGYVHEWPLPVSRFYRSSYHFRSAVAGQADCNTDRGFMGALFTDYHFNFYRRCE